MDNKPTANELELFLQEVVALYDGADLRTKRDQTRHEHITMPDGRKFKVGYYFQNDMLMVRIIDKTEVTDGN